MFNLLTNPKSMVKTLINYQMYIIIGILIFPIFAFIIYFAKNMIDRAKFVRALHNMKKPLMERINSIETIYELKEEKEEINLIIHDIKNDIGNLKKEIQGTQQMLELDRIDQIEKEIGMFYEKMKNPQSTEQQQISTPQETVIVKETPQQVYQNAVIQQQNYQTQAQHQQNSLQKEQARIMNQNISKFLIVYKEKDNVINEKNRIINEKNKSIYILQQKLNEAEARIKNFLAEQKNDRNKDLIIEEKNKSLHILQQRLQEVESKFKNIALLHKSITEKEQIKDTIIEEKNLFIAKLQDKLSDIESKLQNITNVNEDNKEKLLNKKLFDIDEKIQAEKRKNRIFIIIFLLFLLVGI